jgi:hypothetical protein
MLLRMLLFFFTCVACQQASANCMQSFNVKTDKKAVYAPWLPGSDQFSKAVVECRALELAREQLYREQATAIDLKMLGSVQTYTSEVASSLAKLKKAKAGLHTQLQKDETINALIITYRVLKYEFGKSAALVGCMAPEPTASKAFCAIGLVILAEDTASVLDGTITKVEISKRAKQLEANIKSLESDYNSLMSKKATFNMDLAKKRYSEIFNAMCKAVQEQCL